MSETNLFDDEVPTTTEGVSPEAPAEGSQPRDEGGRFAAKDQGEAAPAAPAPAEAQAPAPSAPPAPVEKDEVSGLRRALQEERLKRQQAEQRLMQPPQPAPSLPDPIENPEEYTHAIQTSLQQQLVMERVETSRFHAERDPAIGKAGLAELDEFFNANPQASHQFLRSPSPIHAAWDWLQAEKLRQEIGTDPAAYRERLRAELLAELKPAAAVPPTPARNIPPSMARAGASAGSEPPAKGADPLFG
ncbi:hypothetical protein CNY89_00035 [Amaricoccus sp. HAR-UPW-R2A-40]|nr:hypothetical protein CNY89_00035 [Amaricoccus sp. HAR-UPW-R2A-40]